MNSAINFLDPATLAVMTEGIWKKYDQEEFWAKAGPDEQPEISRRVDRYVLHAVEEVAEAIAGGADEAADVVLYCATLCSVLSRLPGNEGPEGRSWPAPAQGPRIEPERFPGLLAEAVLVPLIDCRATWPERKWHRPWPHVGPAEAKRRAAEALRAARRALCGALAAGSAAYGAERLAEELGLKLPAVAALPSSGMTV